VRQYAGTGFISLLEGSLIVRPAAGQTAVTLVESIQHIKSLGSDAQTAKKALDDQFASLVAKVHGLPLP
jgi:hypothetical protein